LNKKKYAISRNISYHTFRQWKLEPYIDKYLQCKGIELDKIIDSEDYCSSNNLVSINNSIAEKTCGGCENKIAVNLAEECQNKIVVDLTGELVDNDATDDSVIDRSDPAENDIVDNVLDGPNNMMDIDMDDDDDDDDVINAVNLDPQGKLLAMRYVALTNADNDIVDNVLDGPNNMEVLIDKFNVPMNRNKMRCLQPSTWLNDEV
jgi:hypothetical protein